MNPYPFQPLHLHILVFHGYFPMVCQYVGRASFSIDPNTGLSGTPGNNGTFVVGICAKEHRNGSLIGVTKRDFQYTVGVCDKLVTAAFNENIPACNRFNDSAY